MAVKLYDKSRSYNGHESYNVSTTSLFVKHFPIHFVLTMKMYVNVSNKTTRVSHYTLRTLSNYGLLYIYELQQI